MLADSPRQDNLVDWTAGRLLPAPRKQRPTQQETFYPVRCANPECSRVRWLSRSAALKAEQEQRVCRHCQTSQAGKRGYATTVARYGADFALKSVRQTQLAHPSSYERLMASWLEEIASCYQPQVIFSAIDPFGDLHNFILDFELLTSTGRIAVEVNGWHHQQYRTDRDAWLAHLYPGEVVFIDIQTMDAAPDAVKYLLRQITSQQLTL